MTTSEKEGQDSRGHRLRRCNLKLSHLLSPNGNKRVPIDVLTLSHLVLGRILGKDLPFVKIDGVVDKLWRGAARHTSMWSAPHHIAGVQN